MNVCTCTTYPTPHHPEWCRIAEARKAHEWRVFEEYTLRMWRRQVTP